MQWNPDEAIKRLAEERNVFGTDESAQARRLFQESLPVAAAQICHLANFADSEKLRFDAARYVVERNLGSVTREGDNVGLLRDPLDDLLESCVSYVQQQDSQ